MNRRSFFKGIFAAGIFSSSRCSGLEPVDYSRKFDIPLVVVSRCPQDLLESFDDPIKARLFTEGVVLQSGTMGLTLSDFSIEMEDKGLIIASLNYYETQFTIKPFVNGSQRLSEFIDYFNQTGYMRFTC